MCIAIHKPAGKQIPEKHLKESFYSNPDGAGFAVCCPSKGFVIRKGFFDLEEFLAEFEPFAKYPALVHFRIATHGGISPEMCHPFTLCGGSYAMIHNGILDIKPHKGKSDTATFADSVLTPLIQQGCKVESQAFKFLLESAIGSYNKILIMDRYGKVTRFNENSGHEHKGIWYSNDSYKPLTVLPPVKKSSLSVWEKWDSAERMLPRGSMLNDEPACEYCGEPVRQIEELYCDDCLKYMLHK